MTDEERVAYLEAERESFWKAMFKVCSWAKAEKILRAVEADGYAREFNMYALEKVRGFFEDASNAPNTKGTEE